MASNKKTDDERHLAPAEAELRWYFGQGASTAAGDAGQRSSLGSQLARAAAGSKPKRQQKDADGNVIPDESVEVASGAGGCSSVGFIDVDSIERRMAMGIRAVGRLRLVEAALAPLTATYRKVLRLAYGDVRAQRPAPAISPVVVLTTDARKAAAKAVGRVPTEVEIAHTVARADERAPWVKSANAAAGLLVAAATEAFAGEFALVREDARNSRKHRLDENGFWRWVDDGRRSVR
jgi:hypothetical protein